MRLFFRFLLWLSITVLSFQGSAAIAIGQGEVPVREMEMVVATADQHHQAAAQNNGEHCSEHGSKTAASTHAKCAACASCCVGSAAPPGLTPTFHTMPLASTLHANPEAAMTSVVPSILERPPRRLFV